MFLSRAGAGLALAALLGAAAGAGAQNKVMITSPPGTLDEGQIQAGDTGYGLSVFSGFTPARFDVKVVGVLRRALAGQDIILVRCAGQGLEQSHVVAGMSGSPIYVHDRLIGALAYGWSFSAEPIAGVTPIANMLEELGDQGKRGQAPQGAPPGLAPIADPVAVWGISRRVLDRHAAELTALGLVPGLGGAPPASAPATPAVRRPGPHAGAAGLAAPAAAGAGGGPAGSGAPTAVAGTEVFRAPELVPGSAVSVHLLRGDLGMAATGTVTWRDGHRALAFGHPFLGGGPLRLPAGPALIHGVLPRLETSFKLASPLDPTGSMVWDGQAGIVLSDDRAPDMIPVRIDVHDPEGAGDRSFRIEVARVPRLTAALVQVAVEAAMEAAGGSVDDVTVVYQAQARYDDGTSLSLSDMAYVGRDAIFTPDPIARMMMPLAGPVGRVGLAAAGLDLTVHRKRETATIQRVYSTERELTPGGQAVLCVVLAPYGGPEETRQVTLPVPESAAGTSMHIVVSGGNDAPPDVAPPERPSDVLAAIAARHRASDLVCRLSVPGRLLLYRGRVLDRLPLSVLPILDAPNAAGATQRPEVQRRVVSTPWVLEGSLAITVPVKEGRIE